MSVHTILLAGRAVADAETHKSKSDKIFTKFSLAVNEYNSKTKESTPYFYDVLIFGKSSASATEKIKKGDNIFVSGKPEIDAYISKKDAEAKGKITVLADNWKLLK